MVVGPIPRRFLLGGTVLLGAGLAIYHFVLAAWLRTLDKPLGALRASKAVPLYSNFDFHLGAWVLPALVVVGAFVLVGSSFYLRSGSKAAALGVSLVWFWAIGLSVSMIDGYKLPQDGTVDPEPVPSFLEPFSQKSHEYYWDVRLVNRIGGPRHYLHEFAKDRVQGRFSLHGGTHPPGAALFLWSVSQVFGYNLWSTSLAAVAASSLSIVFAFAIAFETFGGAVARISTALLLVTPSLVLFTATSMDGPFSVLILASLWIFVRGAVRPNASVLLHGAALGITLAASAMMTYATFCLGFFFLAVLAIGSRTSWFPMKRVTAMLALAFVAFLIPIVLLSWWSGYDPIAAFGAARAKDAEMMGTGYETVGRYLNITVGNLTAFLIGVGLPSTLLWGRALTRAGRKDLAAPGRLFVTAGALTVLIMGASTLFTLEVERIWLFALPFAAIPAAALIDSATNRAQVFGWTVGLLALQTIVMEVGLNTRW